VLREPPAIEAYGGGGFRVNGLRIEGSILILDDLARPWPVASLAELTPQHFDAALTAGPAVVEFVLLGAGAVVAPPPRAVREAMAAAGMGLEVMDTPAACRLYNVLARDGRRLAAALISI
jgi:uncharacterized protein